MKLVDSFIENYLQNYKPYKDKWNYEDGCILVATECMYRSTGERKFYEFILKYMDKRIDDEGNIERFTIDEYNIDNINSGKVLFKLYETTKNEKYRKAIENINSQLLTHPRTQSGSFWHKKIYPNQIWLDGLYMAQPFYAAYETAFNGKANYPDIFNQFMNVKRYLFDEKTGLYFHGYDESRIQPWCNKETGVSKSFWTRSIGWFLMALVDTLENLSEEIFEYYRPLIIILKESVESIAKYSDSATGLFYQVTDEASKSDNYLETSGSSMIAYAILKGVRLGFIDEKFKPLGKKIFENLVSKKLIEKDGTVELIDICKVAGLGPGETRDGSYEYYISEEICSDDAKGVGPFIMAYSEYIRN